MSDLDPATLESEVPTEVPNPALTISFVKKESFNQSVLSSMFSGSFSLVCLSIYTVYGLSASLAPIS